MKKKWVRPVLTVLTRGGNNSEMVLVGCKRRGQGFWPGHPENSYSGCQIGYCCPSGVETMADCTHMPPDQLCLPHYSCSGEDIPPSHYIWTCWKCSTYVDS